MRVLLDTHVLLWMIGESRSSSATARQILADEANELLFARTIDGAVGGVI